MLTYRRSFLKRCLATICGATPLLAACNGQRSKMQAGSKRLHVFSWADYLHPDTIPLFERKFGIRVFYDTFASNEVLLSKMQAGASNYDVIVPTSYMVEQLAKMNLLLELDKDLLPNFKYVLPRFQTSPFDRGCKFSVPYTWGTTGIGFNAAELRRRGVGIPSDWDVFFDSRLANRMTLLDDARETIGFALKHRGYSYNTTAHEPIQRATQDLIAQKSIVMCYTSDQVIVQLTSEDSLLSLVYSGDAYQAMRDNHEVRYIIPSSGTSIWTDNMCVPRNAPHKENAHLWMNFMMDPQIAAQTANYTRYATPNAAALPLIESALRQDKNLYPSDVVLDKCEQIGDVGSAIFFYDRMWTELKCV